MFLHLTEMHFACCLFCNRTLLRNDTLTTCLHLYSVVIVMLFYFNAMETTDGIKSNTSDQHDAAVTLKMIMEYFLFNSLRAENVIYLSPFKNTINLQSKHKTF